MRTDALTADHQIPQGTVVRLNNGNNLQLCTTVIDGVTGQITSRAEDGKVRGEHLELPPDVSNGLPPNLLLNLLPSTPETNISYVAPGAKPRLVHLSIKPTGSLVFTVGGMRRKATDFTVHVELGGMTGVIAPMIGKEPADYHIWIMAGNPPAFVREEGQLYQGGPIWRNGTD